MVLREQGVARRPDSASRTLDPAVGAAGPIVTTGILHATRIVPVAAR
jgi:hypothetical protein